MLLPVKLRICSVLFWFSLTVNNFLHQSDAPCRACALFSDYNYDCIVKCTWIRHMEINVVYKTDMLSTICQTPSKRQTKIKRQTDMSVCLFVSLSPRWSLTEVTIRTLNDREMLESFFAAVVINTLIPVTAVMRAQESVLLDFREF